MMRFAALTILLLLSGCAGIEYRGIYLNTDVARSIAAGHSAAFLPAAVAGDHRGEVVELFYAREVPGADHHWNWVAIGNGTSSGLPPGHYRVSFVEFGNRTSYGINENDSDIGSFDVAPGEIVYLGHITFIPAGRTLSVVVQDRFEEMRASVAPELRDRMRKRLVRFPAHFEFQTQETYRTQRNF